MKKRVLIIEDEKNIARFMELELQHEGYETKTCQNGREGLEEALASEWDMILLDLMLPELNGLEVCRRIRQEKDTPILMITARDHIMDRVSGLDLGADDYIVKPFAIEELLARMRAHFRRTKPATSSSEMIVHDDLTVDPKARLVKKNEENIELTKREFDLLYTLLENKDIVLTRDVLLEKVWGFDTDVETNVIDVYIRYLRNKLDIDQKDRYIETVRGTGYVIRS